MALTQEDLQAIAGLIRQEIQPMKDDIQSMKDDIQTMKNDIRELNDKLAADKNLAYEVKVNYLIEEVEKLKQEMVELKNKIA